MLFPMLPEPTYLDRSVTTTDGTFAYRVFVPKAGRGKRPAMLFLHGAGERGDDNRAQTKNGIGLLIRDPERFPAIVVAPQCRTGLFWTEATMKRQAIAAFDAAMTEFNGDSERQYLTGLSMGGYGTWGIASDEPTRWAALAPVCGGLRLGSKEMSTSGDPAKEDAYYATARRVAKLPIWVFHGGVDNVVPVAESRQMVAALFALGANVRYSEYPGVGHNSWDNAYAEPELMTWFLKHRRRKPGR